MEEAARRVSRRRKYKYSTSRKKGVSAYYDYTLLFITFFMVCFGLIMIYSTSSYVAQRDYNDAAKFVKGQAVAAILGLIAMIVISKFDYRILRKKLKGFNVNIAMLLFFLCVFLQFFVLVFGVESHGKKRWINLGFTTFQPSELSKVAIIIFMAYLIQKAPRTLDTLGGFLICFGISMVLIMPIAIANLSTAIIVASIVVGMCFVASRKTWYYLVFAAAAIVIVVAYIFLGSEAYRAERIAIWQNIETEPKGYQILQGLYAIASGGLFGTQLGESKQKLGFIPEAHNDMIFTIICEELGLFGAVSVILLFIMLLYRVFVIGLNAKDLFGSLICVGVFVHIAVQVILNIAVVTNSVPSTGVPLPFISYGGTSVSILMAEIVIVMSVSNQMSGKENDA
ncbi:MAG: cell division protein FtsW [Clostridia bacterium]|nr:cell division protein FtsW [Clostridia bacterium]